MSRKTIGILGGLSPESTNSYYDIITREYYKKYGDEHYPEILIFSVDFAEYTQWFTEGQWQKAGREMGAVFERMRNAGAGFGLIAANTPHRALEHVLETTELPLLSIIEVTADAVRSAGIDTVALLGTRFTMQEEFYRSGLAERGLKVIVPDEGEIREIDNIIYSELVKNIISEQSRKRYLEIIDSLAGRGAQGIILGCTEVPLALKNGDLEIPFVDPTEILAQTAVKYAMDKIKPDRIQDN